MSESDTGQPMNARDVRPVVLVIDAPEAQKHLNDDSGVLEVIYGQSPIRLAIGSNSVGSELLRPEIDREETRLALLDRFNSLSVSDLPGFIKSTGFYKVVARAILDSAGLGKLYDQNIRAIIADELLLDGVSSLPEVIKQHFASVAIFKVRWPGRGIPERVKLT